VLDDIQQARMQTTSELCVEKKKANVQAKNMEAIDFQIP